MEKAILIIGAATGTTSAIVSENVLLFGITVLFGIIGWFIQQKMATLDRQNQRVENQLTENNALLNRILGSMEYQDARVTQWHGDREELFERLRAVETRTSVIETNCLAKHGG